MWRICRFNKTWGEGYDIIERHYKAKSKFFGVNRPPKPELTKRKVDKLKSGLSTQQAFYTRRLNTTKNATFATFKVSQLLVKIYLKNKK